MDQPEGTSANADFHSREDESALSRHPEKLQVEIRALAREESLAILARHHVGRIGISFHDLMRVELGPYIYSNGWIYVRTELGEDLATIQHHPWVAFEVDEVDGVFDWRSVEVGGSVDFLSSDLHSPDWIEFESAVALIRSVDPAALTADDPTPQSVRLLRLHVDNIRGREARSVNSATLLQP